MLLVKRDFFKIMFQLRLCGLNNLQLTSASNNTCDVCAFLAFFALLAFRQLERYFIEPLTQGAQGKNHTKIARNCLRELCVFVV